MKVSSGTPTVQTGTWGTISGTVELTPSSGSDDNYVFASIGLSLSGHANARAIHGADPTMPILTAYPDAEFGTTLIWEGIASVHAFDRAGNEIALPGAFEL
jgi:hypothetical protein